MKISEHLLTIIRKIYKNFQTGGNLKTFFKYYRLRINKIFSLLNFSQDNYLLILGSITGILCGFSAVIFHHLIDLIKTVSFGSTERIFGPHEGMKILSPMHTFVLILIPAIGGFLVGLLNKYFDKAPNMEGIPSVMDAVIRKGGIIKGKVAILKIIGTALSIGTGGAGGKEGPIVQIGSSIGSSLGQFLSSSPDRLKILVGCGAAAGLSAAFNTPIGGALFSMEIILRTFNARTYSPIIIASVFGTVISRTFLTVEPALKVPQFQMLHFKELAFFALLGVFAGLISVYFINVYIYFEEKFKTLRFLPDFLKPAAGGLLVGMIGVVLPGIYGFAFASLDSSIYNRAPLFILVLLLFVKPVATALTIGSGGNGGTFAPSIFTGAMLGGVVGQLLHAAFPGQTSSPGAYALVGMGALVAGTIHAPLTALIMVFEMTNNYTIILPLMFSIIIATAVSKSFAKGSLYTRRFEMEGEQFDIYGRNIFVLKQMPVQSMTERIFDFVMENASYNEVLEKFKTARFNSILVLDAGGKVSGQITFQDIRQVILSNDISEIQAFLIARDLMTNNKITIKTTENCQFAMELLEAYDLEYLPVTDENGALLGVIAREDIVTRYHKEILLRQNQL